MTFPKLSCGGRVCETGSHGRGNAAGDLQPFWGEGGHGGGWRREAAVLGRAKMDMLPKMIPRSPNLNLTHPCLRHGSSLHLYFGSIAAGGAKAIEAILGSSCESETGLLKDESS